MFGRKAVHPIDLDTCKDDAAKILQQFIAVPGLSPSIVETVAAYRAKLLESAKKNIMNTQEKQMKEELWQKALQTW